MSKAQAIAQAGSQIGFQHYDDMKVEAAMVQLGDQSLPFLTGQLAGRRTWRIEFSDSSLHEHAKKRLPENRYVKDLVVFLSPDTHQVMKVVSRWPEGVPRITPYPPCAEEERQLKMHGRRYDGLPSVAPGVTLIEALAAAHDWTPEVKQIIACYVLETASQYSRRPVWVIQVRGFPPHERGRPQGVDPQPVRVDLRNYMREVIDARTGEWLGASTIPQPVFEVEDRY